MFLTEGRISDGDYGEESLTARFLLGLILNEYSAVNASQCQAFREFARRCLALGDLAPNAATRATATVEFQTDRSSGRAAGAAVTFDALLTLEMDWVWGIEVKYFDSLKVEQIEKEINSIRKLGEHHGYNNAGVLFIAPEQQLGTLVTTDRAVRVVLQKAIEARIPRIAVASWEMVFEILIQTGPCELKQDLIRYCELRNRNTRYDTKLSTQAKVADCETWRKYITGAVRLPADIPTLPPGSRDSFGSFGKSSTTPEGVFADRCSSIADEAIRRAERLGFEPRAQKTGYVNLSRNGRAHAQLHPADGGVDLVIREADEDETRPPVKILTPVRIEQLHGYRGTNRGWLEGDGIRSTRSRAAAFRIPCDLQDNAGHAGWREVDLLLEYARKK